ncbi:MAG: phospholipase [Chlorobiaceae bacterium]|nr:phospholipase [Chlorobiaceae bacterium]
MQEQYLEIRVSGRYLVDVPKGDGPWPLLAGFHGYGQTAEDELALLNRIPGAEGWVRCAIEALHPFINAKGEPGASWMTRRDRERRIAENVAYVDAVLDRIGREYPVGTLVLHGFSQGAGMACRAAVLGCHRVSGVMLLGGDVPPDLEWLDPMRKVHLARGDRDRLYTQERFEADRQKLSNAGVDGGTFIYRGGHLPTADYFAAAGGFLSALG